MKIKVSELPEFDAAEYPNNEDDVAAYLTTILEENDSAHLAAALGDIARARRMVSDCEGFWYRPRSSVQSPSTRKCLDSSAIGCQGRGVA